MKKSFSKLFKFLLKENSDSITVEEYFTMMRDLESQKGIIARGDVERLLGTDVPNTESDLRCLLNEIGRREIVLVIDVVMTMSKDA